MVKTHESDILYQTIAFWSQRTGQPFSREDARQMVANVSGFFQLLDEWARKEASRDEPDNAPQMGGRQKT
jgi:hypothetical protein